MTWEKVEWCVKAYDDAVFSMNAHFQCVLPINDRFAARDFARRFLPSASLIPANALTSVLRDTSASDVQAMRPWWTRTMCLTNDLYPYRPA